MPKGRTILRARCALALVTVAVATGTTSVAYAVEAPAEAAPTVTLAVDRALVDVSGGPAVVAVSAGVTLPAGVAAVAVRVGDAATAVPLHRVSGTPADGGWSGVVTVPAHAAPGPLATSVDVVSLTGALSTVATPAAVTVADAPPAAPARIAFHAVDGRADALHVRWAAPPANGGSPVTSYTVTAAPADSPVANAVEGAVLTPDALGHTFTGVSPGTRYVARVVATNAAGSGPAAVADATTVTGTVPDGPTGVVAHPEPGALRVEWVPPGSDGGSAVERYDVLVTPRDPAVAAVPLVSVTTTGALVTGLANGAAYDVAVTAVNAAGPGLPGTATGTPRGVPSTPVLGTISAGDAEAVVRWAPPVYDGGAAVASYTVTSSTGAALTLPATARSAVVRDLANGSAVTFAVTATNVAGTGAPATSRSVVPRVPGRLTVVAQPTSRVVYGAVSSVAASLTVAGRGLGGERIELLGQVRPSTTWVRLASGTTASDGRVTLRATLRATAALKLHHPAGVVGAPDVAVRGVTVATRVTAAAADARMRTGELVVVRGNVAPAHPGGTVRLQRHTSDGWRTITSVRLSSTSSYRATWRPSTPGKFLVRVVHPAHSDHTTGLSNRWYQVVDPEVSTNIAAEILADRGIKLETVHVSGVRDLATARQNIVDVAAGRLARRSSYQNAPGGYTTLDRRLLRALRRMGQLGTVTVSEIAGGSHSRGSTHYYGRGLDISYVNGRHVAPGSGYRLAVDACKAFGAVRVFSPSYDPYGGHHNHVHCDW